MKAHLSLRRSLTVTAGVLVCAWSAALMSFFFYGRASKVIVPIAFLSIVVLVSIRFGISAGVIGSAVAALIFAIFLFSPLGSPFVSDKSARNNLAWLVLGGLTGSYLLGTSGSSHQRRS